MRLPKSCSPLSLLGLAPLLAINGVLIVLACLIIMSDENADSGVATWTAGLSSLPESGAVRGPLTAYKDTLAMPVFSKSRVAFVPPPPPAVSAVFSAPLAVIDPGFVLGGIMIKNDIRKAYISTRNDTTGSWKQKDEEMVGWRIRSIDADSATFERHGHEIVVRLYPRQ